MINKPVFLGNLTEAERVISSETETLTISTMYCFPPGENMEKLQEISFFLILTLQQMSPALDGVMNFFTFLGNTEGLKHSGAGA